MEKRISVREWATVKRIAQSVQPMVSKKNNIKAKIQALEDEYACIDVQLQGFEYGIKSLCGGLTTEQLCHKVVTPIEGKYDATGKLLKKTSYEPNDNVRFDTDANQYVITIPDEEPAETVEELVEA